MGIPYSLNVHFMQQTQPALGKTAHVQWMDMDGPSWTSHFQHDCRTNMDELQMHTKAPDADNLKSQVANTQRSQSSGSNLQLLQCRM